MPSQIVPDESILAKTCTNSPGEDIFVVILPMSFMPLPSMRLPRGPAIIMTRISRYVLRCNRLWEVIVNLGSWPHPSCKRDFLSWYNNQWFSCQLPVVSQFHRSVSLTTGNWLLATD